MKNIFIVAGAYIAALIGAGFASGQEIISFFVKYGKISVFSVALASVLFGVFAAAVLEECVRRRVNSYSDYLGGFMNGKMRKAVEGTTLFFGIAVFSVMAACCGEMGYALFGIRNIYGAVGLCVLCGVVMAFKTDDALTLNAVIGGVISIGIITAVLYLLRYREHQAFASGSRMLLSGVSYSGYNLLTAGVILSQLSDKIKSRMEAYLTAVVAAIAMFVIMLLMWGLLSMYHGKIELGEIPLLTLALRENRYIAAGYSIMLFLAVFSTALSNGIGAINILNEKMDRRISLAVVLIAGFCFSGAGFSSLINGVYRVCGYIGAVFMIYIIYRFVKNMKKGK